MSPDGWFVAALASAAVLLVLGATMFRHFLVDARRRAGRVSHRLVELAGATRHDAGYETLEDADRADDVSTADSDSPWRRVERRRTDYG